MLTALEVTEELKVGSRSSSGGCKAIVLLSGGLDSTLAVRLLQEQAIEVLAVNFTSPFCTCSPRRHGSCHLAAGVARELGVELCVLAKGAEYLQVVERPRFGYGRGLNPCIDCRIFMLRKVRGLMEEVGAAFVATGEVLGQRPMSQHLRALKLVERESGLAGRLLRPLSARHLEPTLPEREGLVDRERLLAIQGRSRKEQLALARREGIELFSCGGGGCLLTDPNIARRVEDLFRHLPDYDLVDVKLTTLGRHFRLHERLRVIIGRDEAENRRLAALCRSSALLELADHKGPLMLACGQPGVGDRRLLGRLLRTYAPKVRAPEVRVRMTAGENCEHFIVGPGLNSGELAEFRI